MDRRARRITVHVVSKSWKQRSEHAYAQALNICASPNSYVESITSKVMLLVGGIFGQRLGHESRALMNECPCKRGLREPPCPF